MLNDHGESIYASVWVLTKKNQLYKVESTGNIVIKSTVNFAIDITYSADKTLWVIPVKNRSESDQIVYSDDEGKNWKGIDLQGIKISKISATHLGSCFLLTPQGSVYLIQKNGDIQKIFPEGTANELAVSPEGFIWIISREKKPGGGNLVFWCTYGNFALQLAYGQPVAKKISAGPEGTARIITIGGELASLYVNRMGGLETPGGEPFAKNIAASCRSNTIWTISSDNSKSKKYNVLKFWNPDVDHHMNWHTIPDIEPFVIAGGE